MSKAKRNSESVYVVQATYVSHAGNNMSFGGEFVFTDESREAKQDQVNAFVDHKLRELKYVKNLTLTVKLKGSRKAAIQRIERVDGKQTVYEHGADVTPGPCEFCGKPSLPGKDLCEVCEEKVAKRVNKPTTPAKKIVNAF